MLKNLRNDLEIKTTEVPIEKYLVNLLQFYYFILTRPMEIIICDVNLLLFQDKHNTLTLFQNNNIKATMIYISNISS